MLNGVKNFLSLINDNWTTLTVIFGLLIMLYRKIKSYLDKSEQEKIDIAKQQIREIILKLITDAETDFESWSGAGEIKRSQVIQEIFIQYPILEKVIDQDDLLDYIDECIDDSLDVLRDIIETNNNSFVITTKDGE